MKIYFNNLNIFTWKIAIYSTETVKLTDISNKVSIFASSPLCSPVSFHKNSIIKVDKTHRVQYEPELLGGEERAVCTNYVVCMSKKVRKQVPGAGRYDNMTCYCSVFRREKMTFIRKIFPLNIPLTFLYNSHL